MKVVCSVLLCWGIIGGFGGYYMSEADAGDLKPIGVKLDPTTATMTKTGDLIFEFTTESGGTFRGQIAYIKTKDKATSMITMAWLLIHIKKDQWLYAKLLHETGDVVTVDLSLTQKSLTTDNLAYVIVHDGAAIMDSYCAIEPQCFTSFCTELLGAQLLAQRKKLGVWSDIVLENNSVN